MHVQRLFLSLSMLTNEGGQGLRYIMLATALGTVGRPYPNDDLIYCDLTKHVYHCANIVHVPPRLG